MSVVAGCLLFDGVLMTADTRITYPKQDGRNIQTDNAQKVFGYAPGTVIGYVGPVNTASALLKGLIAERERRQHLDPISLIYWIPRFLRWMFARLPDEIRDQDVGFMIGSSFNGRPTIVEKDAVARILRNGARSLHTFNNNLALRILSAPGPRVAILGANRGLLYSLRAPAFQVEECPPLGFMAIGSGKAAVDGIRRLQDVIFLNSPSVPEQEAAWLRSAVGAFVESNSIDSVGGMYPVVKVRGRSLQLIRQSTKKWKRGTSEIEADVEMLLEGERWVMYNRVNGHRVELKLPWELPPAPATSRLFEYLDRRRNRQPTSD